MSVDAPYFKARHTKALSDDNSYGWYRHAWLCKELGIDYAWAFNHSL